ncbi:MAG: hypothetical protein LC791_11775, partial [Acidobacteria bacterium]|nr:hypothetical protein [Acidobacteriota bacterium]
MDNFAASTSTGSTVGGYADRSGASAISATAMPLCHWPCSCYPNHAMGQVNDWMHEIYPRWV